MTLMSDFAHIYEDNLAPDLRLRTEAALQRDSAATSASALINKDSMTLMSDFAHIYEDNLAPDLRL